MRVVRYDRFTGIDGVFVDEAPMPTASSEEVILRVMASCINPGSVSALGGSPFTPIRDVAGVVTAVGSSGDGVAVGDEVLGWVQEWTAHAEFVAVPAAQLVPKPAEVGWDVAGSMFVTPMAGLGAVRAVHVGVGDLLVIAGASGGVGLTAAQLARHAGATVIGLASAKNAELLRSYDVIPIDYTGDRISMVQAAAGTRSIDAFIDAVGGDSIDLALQLGVEKERINTVVDYRGSQEKGVQFAGTMQAGGIEGLTHLVQLVTDGDLEIPVGKTFPLAEVQAAYRAVSERSSIGRVVLHPQI